MQASKPLNPSPKPDWSGIDTVLLDMDGVLYDLHYDNYFWMEHFPRRYAEIIDQPEAQVRELIMSRIAHERGNLNWYCLDFWSREFDVDIIALKKEVTDRVALRPGALDFLTALLEDGKSLWLLTNAHIGSLSLKMALHDIRPLMSHVVISHDLGYAKEQSEFWQSLQHRHPFNASRSMMIDDTETVLDAASAHGVGHLWTIEQPDSRQTRELTGNYPAIHHFAAFAP